LPAERARVDKPKTAPERETLDAFMDYQREAMILKVEGLTTEQATRRLVPSDTTLLGMLEHLGYVEAWWFQENFAGRDVEYPWTDDDPDADFRIEEDETVEGIIDFYKTKCEESRAVIADASLDDLSHKAARGMTRSLRWIMLHMIEETSRHLGQADILRELTDGATGE
jgi:uncharacterized damage-inducible protein DinB